MVGAFASAQTNCSNATPITPGVYNAAFGAGSQPPSPVCATGQNNNPNMGIWYTYTPTATYTAIIDTNVPGYPIRDTRVHIYSGGCNGLTCVTGDDDSSGGLASLASFTATQNTTYYIVFDNNWNSNAFHFSLTETPFVPGPVTPFIAQSINAPGVYPYCVVDLNGDYLDDIIVSSNSANVNVLYQNATGGFTPSSITLPPVSYYPNWSMAAGDYDKNGYNDLLYGDYGGATIILANDTGTGYSSALQSTQFVFSQRTNFIDINNDGNLDAFVCHDLAPNVYFLNDGNSGFTFHQGGVGDYPSGGNYGSIWVDYDNDGDNDLFIAKCRGDGTDAAAKDELHRNNGDGTFTNVALQAGFSDYHQSWSAAWADYDNDGDMDVMIGASSNIVGSHKLMRNNGDGTFTNVTAGSGYDTQALLNLEHVAHDFDNDGYVDIFGGGNVIMHNNGNMTFTPIIVTATNGPIGDLNNDGFLDIQNGNVVHMNSGNENHWLKIHLEGVESNRNGIGARVEVYAQGTGWTKQIRDVRSGDGFKYMSSLNTHFGLGTTDAIEKLVIKWPSGTVDIIDSPAIDTAILVTEGSTSPVNGLGDIVNSMFTLYPNPAKDVLNIKNTAAFTAAKATIYSIDGKLIKTVSISNNAIPVQQLTKGTYIITLQDKGGKSYSSRFIKD